MKGEAAVPRWRESLGIIVLALSTVALLFVFWQLSNLNREAALDSGSMKRERLVVAMTDRVVLVMQSVFAFEHAAVLDERPNVLPALRSAAGRQINALVADFRTGDAASIAPADHGGALRKAWTEAVSVRPGPSSLQATHAVVKALEDTLQAMQDASNLTYDPSVTAQNLADVRVVELPYAMAGIDRVALYSDLAIKDRGLSLPDRFIVASSINAVRSDTDLTSDNSGQVAQFLKALIPERAAEAGRLPSIAASLYKQGHTFAAFFTNEVLLKPVPTIPRDRVDGTAALIMKSVRGGFDSFGTALDTSLARRGAIENTRSRYLYALYVIGAFFIFGAMIIVAQVIARRDRLALRRAKEESARLSAELAR
ncbi:MAG: hypothetical protein M3N13_05295, partial [Candidatus Eremiobacteraeota bacterium]|nr:hypothetical protein [Candidatus Eremiobacteraeota bacterium]